MSKSTVTVSRQTSETEITLSLDLSKGGEISIETGVPFFEHMLEAMSFHGDFSLSLRAGGDIDVDFHHLVEDIGIVLGEALSEHVENAGAVARFGHSVIPMDEALSEVTIDVSGRPFTLFKADFPQQRIGAFDVSLIREFLYGLAGSGKMTLHAECRRGENSHHMAESLFKALGKALNQAYGPSRHSAAVQSTKGSL